MTIRATLVDHDTRRVCITLMLYPPSHLRAWTAPGSQPGKLLLHVNHVARIGKVRARPPTSHRDHPRKVRARPPTSHHDHPRLSPHINDNCCTTQGGVWQAKRRETFYLVNSVLSVQNVQNLNVNCHAVDHVCFLPGAKERHKTHYKSSKICERCLLYRSVVFYQACHQCPHCCSKSAYWGKTASVLENLGHCSGQSQGHRLIIFLKEGYPTPVSGTDQL